MNGIIVAGKVVQTNCSKMIPKHDLTAFLTARQDKPQANIFEVKKACRKGQKMQKAGRRNVCAENEQEKKTRIGFFSQ